MLRLYDAELDTKRYKVKNVRNFSRKQKARKIKDLAAWKKYCWKFLWIAGSLLNGTKIFENKYATCFWQGIFKGLKVQIESQILTLKTQSETFQSPLALVKLTLQLKQFCSRIDLTHPWMTLIQMTSHQALT